MFFVMDGLSKSVGGGSALSVARSLASAARSLFVLTGHAMCAKYQRMSRGFRVNASQAAERNRRQLGIIPRKIATLSTLGFVVVGALCPTVCSVCFYQKGVRMVAVYRISEFRLAAGAIQGAIKRAFVKGICFGAFRLGGRAKTF